MIEDLSLNRKFEIEKLYREVDACTDIGKLKELTKEIIRQNFEIRHLIGVLGKQETK